MAEVPAESAPHVGNAIAPRPSGCFRFVYEEDIGGFPAPCAKPVAWRGVVVDPVGRRIAVEACEGHAPDLIECQPVRRLPASGPAPGPYPGKFVVESHGPEDVRHG